jgi:hypothetical protein
LIVVPRRKPVRWQLRLAVCALAVPPVLLFVLMFAAIGGNDGANLGPLPVEARWFVLGWLAVGLAATAWLAWRVSTIFFLALIGVVFMAYLGSLVLPSALGGLNRWARRGPTVVHGSFVLAEQSHRVHSKYGWNTYHTTQLADWRDPENTIAYPGPSPVARGEIVCVDEQRGLLGTAWIGRLRACGGDAATAEVAGLQRLALREAARFELDNEVTPLIDAGVPGHPFALATWFDGKGQVRWLAGAVLPIGAAGRAAGIYRGGEQAPSCPLGLSALASDGATVWSTGKSREPAMDLIYPYEMTRMGNHLFRVWQPEDCKLLAQWRTEDWILDADVDLPHQRIALLVVAPWVPSTGGNWQDWVRAHARIELRNWRGERLGSSPLRDVRSPLNAKLQLTPDGLYVRDNRGVRRLAGVQGGALQPATEGPVPAPSQRNWFYDVAAGLHWLPDPKGLMAYAAFLDPSADTTSDAQADPSAPAPSAPAPLRSFRWPLAMFDSSGWQVLAVSAHGASVLVAHADLPHAFQLDTGSGRWQVLAQDLRGTQASFSADGRALASCTEEDHPARCAQLARPDGGVFFRP